MLGISALVTVTKPVSIIGQAVMGKDAGIKASRQDPTTGSSNIQFLFTSLDTSFDNDKH
jgi:hypothetical protein